MANEIKINPNTVLEEALLYKSLEEQGAPVDGLNLPELTPRDEWLLKEAEYDDIMYGLLLSKEENETTWARAQEWGLPKEEYLGLMDRYDLARWGLGRAIQKRHQELDKKDKQS